MISQHWPDDFDKMLPNVPIVITSQILHFLLQLWDRNSKIETSKTFYIVLWPDLAKFYQFGNILKVFGRLLRVYLLFGKDLKLPWEKIYAIGRIFIALNGKTVNK